MLQKACPLFDTDAFLPALAPSLFQRDKSLPSPGGLWKQVKTSKFMWVKLKKSRIDIILLNL